MEDENFKIRASAVSDNTGYITFKVYPENSQGNIVSGAVVTVTDASNVIHLLDFSSSNQFYTKTIEGITNSEYTIQVSSNCITNRHTMIIPHTLLTEKPAVSVLNDSDSNSALSGKELQSNQEIQLAWNNLGVDLVYNVSIKSTLKTVFSKSTQVPFIMIPADSLEKNSNYTLYINAQKIYGDPYFINADYYSVSSITSSGLSFFTK
jgi:hypothetical protein